MRRSLKASRFWRRLISGVMTIVMLVTILPTAAFAALWDNSPDENKAILEQLTAFWGDEKTAQEAMELLRQYGLIDEDGSVLTDWSGKIAIREEGRSLTIGEVRALSGGEVTVNGHPCAATELNETLEHLEALGLLVDNVPAADWQLQVDGQSVSPAQLAEVLDSWTAPEQPQQPEQPEQPQEPETPEEPEQPEQPTEPEPETPEQPQGGGTADPVEAGGILASIGRFFGVGDSTVTPAAPVVTVLGESVDSGDLQEVIDFLDQYGLLTDAGCAADWTLTLPGGERETDVSELLSMLESGDYDPDMVITVDGTPVTMADFATMMEIQKEIQRIRDTYLKDNVELTPEQASNLYELYQQLQANGIKLYNTQGADALVFPSDTDHTQRVSVPQAVTMENGGESDITIQLDHTAKGPVTVNWRIAEGSASGRIGGETEGSVIFSENKSSEKLTVTSDSSNERWYGSRSFVIEFTAEGALFANGTTSASTVVYVTQEYPYETELTPKYLIPLLPNAFDSYQVGDQLGEYITYPDGTQLTVTGIEGIDNKGLLIRQDPPQTGDPYAEFMLYNHSSHYVRAYPKNMKAGEAFEYSLRIQYPKEALPLVEDGILDAVDPSDEGFIRASTRSWDEGETRDSLNLSVLINNLVSCSEPFRGLSMRVTPVSIGRKDTNFIFTVKMDMVEPDKNDSHILFSRIVFRLVDNHDPAVVNITAPQLDGSYQCGQSVPITVEFSEPVRGAGMILTANGKPLEAVDKAEGHFSHRQTFLLPVEPGDSTSVNVEHIDHITDTSNRTVERITPNLPPILPVGSLATTTLRAAMPDITKEDINVKQLTYIPGEADQEEKTIATIQVYLRLPDDDNFKNLLLGTLYETEAGLSSGALAASVDGGENLIPLVMDEINSRLTATVEVNAAELVGITGAAKDFVMEFYTLNENHDAEEVVFGRYAAFSVNKPVPLTGEDLSIQTPDGWPTTPIYVNDPPEDAALTLKPVVDAPEGCTWTQTRWVAGNPEIATIDPSAGVIRPLAKGTAEFWLEAVNGNLKDYAGERSKSIFITIQEGANPYLRIPEENSSIRSGDSFTLRWASNLVQKNMEYGAEGEGQKTTFTINVYLGKDTSGTPVKTYTVTYDPGTPDGTITMGDSTTIPMWTKDENGALTPNQTFIIPDLTNTGSGYTIVISAEANSAVPSRDEQGYTAQSYVTVVSQPVSVKLERPHRLFVTNGEGALTIPYTLTSFDAAESGGAGADFKLTVTDNATGKKVLETTQYEDYGTIEGGQFTIDLSDANITDGFRTIYDVSLQAKNTAEPDWSRDSFTLYIYDQSALDILVQPVIRNEITTVDVSGDTITMSNEDWIASLSRDEILALERDIDLQAAISINYGDHAWGEASDRIRWAVKNSGIAAVNYPQGAYYENIEGLPYSSFAPATEFLLSGKNDGTTVVEAIHNLAGDALSSSVEVTVETLKDKLYLFQFYPARGGLTATYTNGDGKIKTASGDSQGRFAIYEPSGITSDVYVKGEIDEDIYLGTVYHSRLVSQEKDAVSLELYPLNSLTLRKAASLPVYLLDEEGKPFNGNVTVRAGVYRNGEYCAGAKYALKSGGDADIPGTKDQTVTFTDGKATFYYDLTQFNTNGGADPVTAADDIQFALELRAGNGTTYYPVLFTASGTTNEYDAIRMAERIITLEKVPDGQANKPFVARQAAYFSGRENGPAVDVRNQNGKLGPGFDYPDLLLSTTVLWWGEDADVQADAGRSIRYVDNTGIALQGQQMDNSIYPFCSMPVTHSTVHLDQSQLSHLGLKDLSIRTITLQYIDGAGITAKQENMRWQLINALNLNKTDDLEDAMDALLDIVETEDGVSGIGSGFLNLGLQLATSASIDSDFLTLQLAPTKDPTVFRGLVYVGAGFGTDGVSGADGPGNLIETMDVEDESSYDLNYMPGLEDVAGVISGGLAGYGQNAANELSQSAKDQLNKKAGQRTPVTPGSNGQPSTGSGNDKKGQMGANVSLSGYFETEVYYDFNAGEWKMQLVTGGFQAGGSFGYEWSYNFQVGPVPLFLEIGIGMSAKVDFNAAVNNVENVNDYLTQLQLQAYIEAFGGFGFDYAVVALKLGIFGELSLTAQLRWLNAARAEIGEQFGHKVDLAGEVGVKAEVTVLFISYSAVLWSTDFSWNLDTSDNWGGIEDYWKAVGAGKSGAAGIVPEGANLLAYDAATGTAILSAQQGAALVDRDYLSQYGRSYNSAGPGERIGLLNAIGDFFTGNTPNNNVVKTIPSAYSYASPVITDDGEWLFYLDDMENSKDATVVRVSAAPKNDKGGYDVEQQAALNNDGYGDSGLKAAGDSEHPVAVWSRVMEKPAITEPGQTITPDIQAAMMNSSDIMVAVRSNGSWKVQNLTATTQDDPEISNGLADLSPVVAASGENILVAWRQVASSDAVDLTNFDARDYIYFRYSSDYGKTWTDAQPIYNGTSGAVKGIEAAMLPDGTAAVAFTLQTGTHDSGSGEYSQEIAYAIVGQPETGEAETLADGTPAEYQVLRYVQMTDDENLDENPQLAAVKLDETKKVFILGWHSLSTEGGSDIRLAAVDTKGNRVTGFVDSLSNLIQNTGVAVSANFQFVQNAESLSDLSILWSETVASEEGMGENEPSQDALSALRFRLEGDKISVTSAQRLVEMDAYTTIDNFNAYVDNGDIYSVLQGTFYDYSNPETIAVGNTTVQVATDVTNIYTAKGGYTESLRVDSIIPDYPNIKSGMPIPVQVGVTNLGTQPMSSITVKIGEEEKTFEAGKDGFVAVAPGETRTLTVFYTVKADEKGQIIDPKYTVTGTIGDSTVSSEERTLVLNIPDLGIADSKILVGAEDGDRILQFTLYNESDAKLSGSGNSVQFRFYSDPECTQPIDNSYFEEETLLDLFANGEEPLKTISGSDLTEIDEGIYTLRYRFDLERYIQQTEEDSTERPFADEKGEVRDGGITLYAKAWVQMDGGEMMEFNSGNNTASVTVESLLKQADDEHVTITSQLSQKNGEAKVDVTLQNNSIVDSENGNVIVTLLDKDGKMLGQKQSYTGGEAGNDGLVALKPEARTTLNTFTFSDVTNAVSAQVTYSDVILDGDNANLTSLSFSNIAGINLSSFQETSPGVYTAAVSTDDLTSTTVMASTASNLAKATAYSSSGDVAMAEEGSNMLGVDVPLTPGETTTITVEVRANNNKTNKYILTVQNNGDPVINWGDSGEDATKTPYGTEVYYAGDNATINLTATQPVWGELSYQWYSCKDAGGTDPVPLTDETGSSLEVSTAGKDAGSYFYYCIITRHMADGGTKTFRSSVATVQVRPIDGNAVTLKDTVVDFNNEPHGLTPDENGKGALMDGSTLHYSTDGGKTWTEKAPKFTAVGVYSVQVYATHQNYNQTETVTHTITIQENSSTQFKLETQGVSEAFESYPEAITSKYGDAAGLETALKTEVTKLGVPEDNTEAYDVKLMFSTDGGTTWVEAKADNFPAAGITVKLPYPEGTDRYGYNFTLLHLITDPLNTGKTVGDIETMDITLEEDGIRFTADCLSPFVLGWERRPSSPTRYTVAERDTEHGSFTVKPTRAERGDTVTITSKPDEGYAVDAVSVTTRSGKEISVQNAGGGKYTFTMPASAVYVQVTFKPEKAEWVNPFVDVPEDAWYYDAVQYVNEKGLMAGTSANTFAPDLTTTRGMIVTILYRLEGAPNIEDEIWGYPFKDVDANAYYATAVYWARMNGIVAGYSDELFGPNDTITREQMATILYRYAQYKGYDTTAKADLSKYTDAAQVGSWATDAIRWANAEGLVNGTSATTLTPKGSATRAQVAVILTRFCQNIVG